MHMRRAMEGSHWGLNTWPSSTGNLHLQAHRCRWALGRKTPAPAIGRASCAQLFAMAAACPGWWPTYLCRMRASMASLIWKAGMDSNAIQTKLERKNKHNVLQLLVGSLHWSHLHNERHFNTSLGARIRIYHEPGRKLSWHTVCWASLIPFDVMVKIVSSVVQAACHVVLHTCRKSMSCNWLLPQKGWLNATR